MSADAAENLGVMDVMGVGKAKIKYNLQSKTYKDYPANEPEEVYFANRAQMNQVEQMASYMATWYNCMSWKGHGCFLKWWYPQIIHFNRVFH